MAPVRNSLAVSAPMDLDGAVEHVASGALRSSPLGPVGLELEGHLVDLDAPGRRVPWTRIRAVVDALPPLPGGSLVSLEPGGQVELSGPPAQGVATAVARLRADRRVLGAAQWIAAQRGQTEAVGIQRRAQYPSVGTEPCDGGRHALRRRPRAVSYTHLTLPTN